MRFPWKHHHFKWMCNCLECRLLWNGNVIRGNPISQFWLVGNYLLRKNPRDVFFFDWKMPMGKLPVENSPVNPPIHSASVSLEHPRKFHKGVIPSLGRFGWRWHVVTVGWPPSSKRFWVDVHPRNYMNIRCATSFCLLMFFSYSEGAPLLCLSLSWRQPATRCHSPIFFSPVNVHQWPSERASAHLKAVADLRVMSHPKLLQFWKVLVWRLNIGPWNTAKKKTKMKNVNFQYPYYTCICIYTYTYTYVCTFLLYIYIYM